MARLRQFLMFISICLAVCIFSAVNPGSAFAETPSIDFAYIESAVVSSSRGQNIAIGFNSLDSGEPEKIGVIRVSDGSEFDIPLVKTKDNVCLFSSTQLPDGTYRLGSVYFKTGSVQIASNQSEQGSFVVDISGISMLEGDSEPKTEYSDDEGNSFSTFGTALDSYSLSSGGNSSKVIVLDPGHGGWDSGASANGLIEKNLTLKIAQYCRSALQQYSDVKIIMTRYSDVSPSGTTNTSVDLQKRANIARDNKANLLVSFHINAGGGTGAEVWIPRNSSWYSSFYEMGDSLGKDVLNRLSAIGLVNRGTKNDYYDYNGKQLYYPDGSRADSLAVIRHCREYGIPAVLIEHGFIDKASDAGYLSSDWYLKRMGEADAEAIANQLGLKKTGLVWDSKGLRYINEDGSVFNGGWKEISGKKYYFKNDGYAARYETKIDGKLYYFLGSDCSQVTGWLTWYSDGSRSYFDPADGGAAAKGWLEQGGKRYYFRPSDFHAARYETKIDGKLYYFLGSDCSQVTGWLTWYSDGSRSYFDPADGGAAAKGLKIIDGKTYLFNDNYRAVKYGLLMGQTKSSLQQMTNEFDRVTKGQYPSSAYSRFGASTIVDFCRILREEAGYEGVNGDVLFAQVMLETNYLRFGNDVKSEQCNFGGLGATGNGNPGLSFSDVRTGIRAQVQHLKAYGSHEPLNNACVDPRFLLVTRGSAPTIFNLSGKWAASQTYGESLDRIIRQLLA